MTRAAAPETWGAAIDVPLLISYLAGHNSFGTVLRMFDPGAPKSIALAPKLEKWDNLSSESVAATPIIFGKSNPDG